MQTKKCNKKKRNKRCKGNLRKFWPIQENIEEKLQFFFFLAEHILLLLYQIIIKLRYSAYS